MSKYEIIINQFKNVYTQQRIKLNRKGNTRKNETTAVLKTGRFDNINLSSSFLILRGHVNLCCRNVQFLKLSWVYFSSLIYFRPLFVVKETLVDVHGVSFYVDHTCNVVALFS